MSLAQSLVGSKVKSLKTPTGYTQATKTPMALMFGQPNNTDKLNFKMESIQELSITMLDVLRERSQSLDFVMRETMTDIKGFFALDSKVVYEITDVPYTRLASVRLPNIIGLKTNLHDYANKLVVGIDLAKNILEFELNGLAKLVAQLLTSKDALTSLKPISAIADLKMHTTDVAKIKEDLGKVLGHEANNEYVEFGSIYFSINDWKDCGRTGVEITKKLQKIKSGNYDKDIKNITVLMDKLIMRIQDENIPRDNIEEYSKLIEQTSNNVAFAGAVVHMCQTLIQTLKNHNDILRVEIDDFKKHRK